MPDAGPPPVVFASGQNFPVGIAVDSTNVYWMDYGGSSGSVMMCPRTGCGGAPTTLAAGQVPYGLAIDSANVYWTNINGPAGDAGAVMKCAIAGCGGNPTPLMTGLLGPIGIAADSTNVYWTNDFGSNGSVMKCAIGGCGGAPTTLAANQAAYGIAVDSSNVYWTSVISDTVSKCAIAGCGGNPTTLWTGPQNASPASIMADSNGLYWTVGWNGLGSGMTDAGLVMACPAGGCSNPTTLAGGQWLPNSFGGLAADPTSLYWTTGQTGLVMKLTPK